MPKEICARSKINPRRIQKPAIQKWCYTIEEAEKTVSTTTKATPECVEDVECEPGYTCVQEEGVCRARPGKVGQAWEGRFWRN